ncbi:MAG TPA: leucine--tRNA ligase [Patescibacteria group bacterium]|jgi:leucyl-tRNA synthetase|nr:leucine--tRNA ligase [Patescibacteria group bacterium]
MKRYNPKEVEPKRQKQWADSQLYRAVDFDDQRPKYVMLTEFPYPSGDGLHLGHVREYTLGDIMARYRRMNGYNVLFPMGYDAFGLPTENYAIKNKITPQQATADNIATFRRQFDAMGFSFDWDRSFSTSDPEYYRWTQWLFLQFHKAGLAYQAETAINWCPSCRTGLSNEEVVAGRHERCDTLVEKRMLKQWLLKITEYADRLIDGLNNVDYSDWIAQQQINWIGKSTGSEIVFKVADSAESINVFTTRPDTIFGATFMVLAPEHPLLKKIVPESHRQQVNSYIASSLSKTEIERQETEREKTGVFSGAYAINPLSDQKIPIWIGDYVLIDYGSGAIMAVPAHDERDWAFAKTFDLPIKRVIKNDTSDDTYSLGEGVMIDSGSYNGLPSAEAREKMTADLIRAGQAKDEVHYHLRDWIFSRQHYWGEPIPIIHCPQHGAVAVPDDQLPVVLPVIDHYEPTDNGESPLSLIEDWVNVPCPACGQPAKRETDTMPNWAGSSWYYLRYFDPHNNQQFADQAKLDYWGMVDMYLGGMEHTTLHLLYSRFWHQFGYDQGLLPTPEPYAARRGQGIVLAADGSKMSKSKGNVINPSDIIDRGYGADSLRLAIGFLAPYDQTTAWTPEGVAGTFRFLQRIWTLTQEFVESDQSQSNDSAAEPLLKLTHKTIAKVTEQLINMGFNTAIASLMEYVNGLYKLKAEDNFTDRQTWQFVLQSLVKLLAPFAPHIADELWTELGQSGSVHNAVWPVADGKYLTEDSLTIVIQVNGKLRGEIVVASGVAEDKVVETAKQNEKIKQFLDGKEIIRTVYVPGKLVNFVVND